MLYLKVLIPLMLLGAISCTNSHSNKAGYDYVHHVQTQTPTPQVGDKVFFHVDVLYENQIVESSRDKGRPARLTFRDQMNSPIEAGLSIMGIGDSLSVFTRVDTLYPSIDFEQRSQNLQYNLVLLSIESDKVQANSKTAYKQ